MIELLLIGIGTGNPDHLTGEAARMMNEANLILIPRKGADKSDLADLRKCICDRVLSRPGPRIIEFDLPKRASTGDYLQAVDDWHDAIAAAWVAAIPQDAPPDARVALLIWGDPSLYDSSLRIAARLSPQPTIRVAPGITALQALTAAHAIPVNDIGAPFVVTTGRRLREHGWPEGVDTAAVMLDGSCAFQTLPQDGYDIWWGAFLGMPNQMLFQGPLARVGPEIIAARATARADHGWIMDIYLLRKTTPAA